MLSKLWFYKPRLCAVAGRCMKQMHQEHLKMLSSLFVSYCGVVVDRFESTMHGSF